MLPKSRCCAFSTTFLSPVFCLSSSSTMLPKSRCCAFSTTFLSPVFCLSSSSTTPLNPPLLNTYYSRLQQYSLSHTQHIQGGGMVDLSVICSSSSRVISSLQALLRCLRPLTTSLSYSLGLKEWSAWLPECHLGSLSKSVGNLSNWHEGSHAGPTTSTTS